MPHRMHARRAHQVTVEYRNLNVRTDALIGSAGLPSVGNSFMLPLKVGPCGGVFGLCMRA